MMPPYTSLWLQSLFEIKGTAAWLRTGEASPASEWGREGRAVRGSPAQNAEGTHPAEVAMPTGAAWGPRGAPGSPGTGPDDRPGRPGPAASGRGRPLP